MKCFKIHKDSPCDNKKDATPPDREPQNIHLFTTIDTVKAENLEKLSEFWKFYLVFVFSLNLGNFRTFRRIKETIEQPASQKLPQGSRSSAQRLESHQSSHVRATIPRIRRHLPKNC